MLKVKRTVVWCALLVTGVCAHNAYGSDHPPLFPNFCEFDLDYNWFEPIYCDCPDPPVKHEGFYFAYDRVNWNVMTPPRYGAGDNGLRVSSTLVNSNPLTTPLPTVGNAVDVAQPDSEFGWGNRFDVGYIWNDAGWNLGIIGNFNAVDSKTYGAENLTAAAPQPFTGSVAVLFTVPAGLLDGSIDVDGDGVAEDINGDGILGNDRVTFIPSFDTLTIDHRTRVDGVELMRTLRRDDFFARDSTVEFLYGLRFLRVDNEMRALGVGGFLADSNWASEVENKMFGPQVGIRWAKRRGRWSLRSEGRFMAALNVRDASLEGIIASLHQPGTLNNSDFLNPTSFAQYDSDVAFSPVAEARLEAVYHFTKKFSFKVGYTGTYASNMGYGSNMVDYTLPELTLRSLDNLDTNHFFSNGLNMGFEINR